MKKTNRLKIGSLIAVGVLVIGMLAFAQIDVASAASPERRGGPGGSAGFGQRTGSSSARSGIALTPLSETEIDALNQAILEEYGALNLYQNVISTFGNVYPFSQIVKAEQQHVNVLLKQAAKYGVTPPANPGLTTVPVFATIEEACAAGVNAEIADAALYDDLSLVVTHTDILQVFNNLQSASLNSHLPAFQICQ